MNTKKTLHMILALAIFVALALAINTAIEAGAGAASLLYLTAALTIHAFETVWRFGREWKKADKGEQITTGSWNSNNTRPAPKPEEQKPQPDKIKMHEDKEA